MSFPVDANSTYTFRAYIIFKSDDVYNGIGFSINGPTNPVYALHQTTVMTSSVSSYYLNGFGYDLPDSTSTAVYAADANHLAVMNGTIQTGANGGTLILRWRGETVDGTYTVVAGSSILYSKVN
jgi:hypothetical protein